MAWHAHLHCRGARIQARLDRPQVQGKVWRLANTPVLASDRALARSLELGALAQHRVCKGEGGGMTSSVYTRTASGRTKRRRHGQGPTFIQLFHWMVDLPVWHSLSPRAVVAYLELARRFNGTNNGTLHLSVRELARAWNLSRASAA